MSGKYKKTLCTYTTCSKCNISDLAILFRGWNFASGLLTYRLYCHKLLTDVSQLTATVSLIGIVLAYDQMRILKPLWKVTLRYVSLQICGVQFLIIRLLILSHSKVVLHERCMSDFWRRNWSNFRRMCLWICEVVCTCTSNLTEKLVIFRLRLEFS